MNKITAHGGPSSLNRTTRSRRDHAVCQALEVRRLLAINITWANRATTDNFATEYGTNAAQARTIVDRAIQDWEAVITSFNRSGGTENYTLNVFAAPIDGRGVANVTALTNGKPSAATITMDDNGDGAGWYFDPFVGVDGIPDDGEFTTPVSPFTSGDVGGNADFYRTAAHEMGHAMGIYNGDRVASFATDVGDDPNSGQASDRLLGIDTNGNGINEYTLTTDGGGHLFEGGGSYTGPVHPNSLLNSGRTYVNGRRQIIGDVESDILRDALGYTVVSPNSINTFWANLNRTSNVLTVTGDINPSGSNVDSIVVDVVGTDTRIRVGGTTELIPNAEYTTLVVNAGNDSDTIRIDGLPAGKGVTVNGGSGNDLIVLAELLADLDSGIDSDVSINGGTGTDSVRADDQLDGANSDSYAITSTSLVKGSVAPRTFNLAGDLELLTVNGSNQASTWTIASTAFDIIVNGGTLIDTFNVNGVGAPITLNGGAGNDVFNVGGGDFDSFINDSVRVVGDAGIDRLTINDVDDNLTPTDIYEINGGSFTKDSAGGVSVSFGSTLLGGASNIEEFVLNASDADSRINVNSTGASSFVIFPNPPTIFPVASTINGGGGNDAIVVATAGSLTAIRGNISVSGGAGADLLTFNDTADTENDPFTLTHNLLTNTDWDFSAAFNTSSETVTLNAGSGNNIINYNDTGAAPSRVVLNGNNGIDSFEIIEGTATVNGGAGLDHIDVNQTEAGVAGVVFESNQDLGTMSLFGGSTVTVATDGNLVIDANSTGTLRGILNLNNNSLISRTTSQSFLVDKLTRGYNGGGWNGVPAGGPAGVIRSATAAATTATDAVGYAQIGAAASQLNIAVFRGTSVSAGNMVITYTLSGDTNLDRTVSFPDLVSLAQNYNLPATTWVQGNFNYDNLTDFGDLVPLAQNYNLSVLHQALRSAELESWPLGRGEKDRLAAGSRISDRILELGWDERARMKARLA